MIWLIIFAALLALTVPNAISIGYWYFRKQRGHHTVPCLPVVERYFYDMCTGKLKHLSLGAIANQYVLGACKIFEKEGICRLSMFSPYFAAFSQEAIEFFSYEPAVNEKPHEYEILKRFLGEGLLTCEYEKWKRLRKVWLPSFHNTALKEYCQSHNRKALALVEDMKKVSDEPWIHLSPLYRTCAFGGIMDKLFGNEQIIENTDVFFQMANKMSEAAAFYFPPLLGKFGLNLTAYGRECLKTVRNCHLKIKKIISKSREEAAKTTKTNDGVTLNKSFYDILNEESLRNPNFTEKILSNEILTFITAGYETTAFALLCTTYLLGLHPEVQEKLYDEIQQVNDIISYEDVTNMKYMECVIKESFRIFPSVPMVARRLTKDVVFKQYKLPKNAVIAFPMIFFHKNAAVYPNPERFIPERFFGKSEKPFTYQPFGIGSRTCIGQKLAKIQMSITLAHVVRNFQIQSLDPRDKINVKLGVVNKWEVEPRIKLSPRNNN